jgi:hypothetical protein
MAVNLSPLAGAGSQFFDDSGNPLTGGLLYSYAAGTTTPATTYTSNTGSVANPNPIILDSAGRPPNEVWLTNFNAYKFVLQNSAYVQIWTMDNISAIRSGGTQSYQTATAGQTVFTGLNYTTSNNSMQVFVNGLKKVITLQYIETNSTTITFLSGLTVGDIVEFVQ